MNNYAVYNDTLWQNCLDRNMEKKKKCRKMREVLEMFVGRCFNVLNSICALTVFSFVCIQIKKRSLKVVQLFFVFHTYSFNIIQENTFFSHLEDNKSFKSKQASSWLYHVQAAEKHRVLIYPSWNLSIFQGFQFAELLSFVLNFFRSRL